MSSNIKVQRICKHCGKEFTARTTTTLNCSPKCAKAAYKDKLKLGKIDASNKETKLIKTKPIEELKAKVFLSISDTCKLVGISRRTIYRMIQRGELIIGKAGKRTIIKRSDLDKLFDQPQPVKPKNILEQKELEISECYNLNEVKSKYRISDKALHELIKRNSIPKLKKGRFTYVPKTDIDKILS